MIFELSIYIYMMYNYFSCLIPPHPCLLSILFLPPSHLPPTDLSLPLSPFLSLPLSPFLPPSFSPSLFLYLPPSFPPSLFLYLPPSLSPSLPQLTVVVEDKGVPIMSSSAIVMVTVVDVNDEPPLFERDRYDRYGMRQKKLYIPLCGG